MSLAGLEKWKPGGEYERAGRRAFEAFERGDYDRAWRITRALIGSPATGLYAFAAALYVAFIAFVLIAALPVAAREDFTQRDSCKGHWGDFLDGTLATASADSCSGGSQDGDNPVNWNATGTSVDDGDAPSGSRSGADSLLHDYTSDLSVGSVPTIDGQYLDFSFLQWRKRGVNVSALYSRRGAGSLAVGDWSVWCNIFFGLRFFMSGTPQDAAGGPQCTNADWFFSVATYDGTGTDTLKTYASTGQGTRTLFDCDGSGGTDCATEADGPKAGATPLAFNSNAVLGVKYDGNSGEMAYFNEVLSAEEICQACRCAMQANLRGVGRTDECNRCDLPAFQTCRRFID
jgi:hypothetical protein